MKQLWTISIIFTLLLGCADGESPEPTSVAEPALHSAEICGRRDNRTPSNEPEFGRILNSGGYCSATLIGRQCVITAGHCFRGSSGGRIEFNVPKSYNRRPVRAADENIYHLDPESLAREDVISGRDWAVAKLQKNEITGLYPGDVQGYKQIMWDKPQRFAPIQITGYGQDKYESTRHRAQQTHSGVIKGYRGSRIYHNVDTMPGNSGSSIVHLESGKVIGVHTAGGCDRRERYSNRGTMLTLNDSFAAAVERCLASEAH